MPFSAVVSLLDQQAWRQVEACWDFLEDTCGLKGIRITPYPHISWQVARHHNQEKLFEVLARRAAASPPVMVRCAGLGIFSGQEPVLYVQVVKDPELMEFHRQVWEETKFLAEGLSSNYDPDAWIPHITLAYRDITRENIACVLGQLAFDSFTWQIRLNNLAVVTQVEDKVGEILQRFDFKEDL